MIFTYDVIQVVHLGVGQERRSLPQGRWEAIITARGGDEEAIITTATGPRGGGPQRELGVDQGSIKVDQG